MKDERVLWTITIGDDGTSIKEYNVNVGDRVTFEMGSERVICDVVGVENIDEFDVLSEEE